MLIVASTSQGFVSLGGFTLLCIYVTPRIYSTLDLLPREDLLYSGFVSLEKLNLPWICLPVRIYFTLDLISCGIYFTMDLFP